MKHFKISFFKSLFLQRIFLLTIMWWGFALFVCIAGLTYTYITNFIYLSDNPIAGSARSETVGITIAYLFIVFLGLYVWGLGLYAIIYLIRRRLSFKTTLLLILIIITSWLWWGAMTDTPLLAFLFNPITFFARTIPDGFYSILRYFGLYPPFFS